LLHEPDVLVDVRLHDRLFAGREEFIDGQLLSANELSEETPLGEKLVNENGADRVGLFVRLEVEQNVRHGPPDASGVAGANPASTSEEPPRLAPVK
jgi:hypothetical protein